MLIKELHPIWPPIAGFNTMGGFAKPDLADVLINVQNGGSNNLILNLRKGQGYGQRYGLTLNIPENMVQQAILSIAQKRGSTLFDIGDIKIA